MTVSTNPFFEDDDFFFPPPDPPQQDPLMGLKGPPPSNGTASDIPVVSQLSRGNDTHAGVSETEVVDLCSVDGDGSRGNDGSNIHASSGTRAGVGTRSVHGGGTTPKESTPLPFKRSDMFKGVFPISSSEKARLLSCRPVDWSDSFCSDLHLSIDSDLKIWKDVFTSFGNVTSLQDLQRFLSCDLNGSPFAFLGTDHDKKLCLIHNVLLAPDSGSIVNPSPSFICLTQAGFDSPQVSLVSNELRSVLISTEYSGIPSLSMIFEECVSDLHAVASSAPIQGSSRPSDSFPNFQFDGDKFENLSLPEETNDDTEETKADSDDNVPVEDPNTFEYMGIFPLHPSIAGELLKLFSKVGYDSPQCSPKAVAVFLFRFLVRRWARSIGRDRFLKSKSVDISHPVFAGVLPLFRFLWIVQKKPRNVDPLVMDVPSKFDVASKLFHRHKAKAFPDQNSPFRLGVSDRRP